MRAAGKHTVTVVPTPTSLSIPSVPPSSSTSLLASGAHLDADAVAGGRELHRVRQQVEK
jgi:hypothetical protein